MAIAVNLSSDAAVPVSVTTDSSSVFDILGHLKMIIPVTVPWGVTGQEILVTTTSTLVQHPSLVVYPIR